MRLIHRPIDQWPGQLRTEQERKASPFDATWSATLNLLDLEVRKLGADEVVLQVAVRERDIRLDGGVRADAKADHPGVIISFQSRYGPLKYSTDVFKGASWKRNGLAGWQANVRAIALGLEALRKVDRYDIARRGEQYVGWKQLGSGIEMPAATMDPFAAAEFLVEYGEWGGRPAKVEDIINAEPDVIASYFREAAKKLHPDTGGDPELFKQLVEARRVLETSRTAA